MPTKISQPGAAYSSHTELDIRKGKRTIGEVASPPRRKRSRNALAYTEVDNSEEHAATRVPKASRKTSRTQCGKAAEVLVKRNAEGQVKLQEEETSIASVATPIRGKGKRSQVKDEVADKKGADSDSAIVGPTRHQRKAKGERREAMPLASRTLGSKVLIGAHVSSAGGVQNAILESVNIGGNALALFLKSQRKWENPALRDEQVAGFLSHCREHKYGSPDHAIPPIVPHGSYLVNLAHPDPPRAKQAYDSFLDDLQRCSKLGIRLYNFHPGNCGASETRAHAIAHLAQQLNKAHKDPSSGDVVTLLETMTSSTNVLGATFEDLAQTIDLIDDKERVGVCLDTCHVFAAGYDLRTPETFRAVMDKFDEIVGLKYLKALHMNDSKAPFNSGRDLHANIGTGFLGLRAFHNIMNEPRLWGLPMVLETPIEVKNVKTGKEEADKSIWAREIKLLESLVGMDVESAEFLQLEAELHSQGQAERDRIQAQVDKKGAKAKRTATVSKANPANKKGKKASTGRRTAVDSDSS
ncbi:uncharacterized protein PV09_05649 [Verruconis gallopava]|uniref:Apurinic-apyrimidinic endonuclease 1 n=1 Tax=Verruconis gallopava TaxID=253628 RepID=A0A0D2A8W1_9PEZI|nr:uncharacterized protein PV09_05649 [Verruconis gallopava]KIW02990.1 hypothetical protein PV09_05649 [Verruconis gallopava]